MELGSPQTTPRSSVRNEAQPATDTSLFGQALRIASFAKPYRGRIALGVMLMLLGTAATLVFPLAISAVVDTAVQGGDAERLHLLSIAILVLFLIRAGAGFLGMFTLETVGERLVLDLKRKLFRVLVDLDLDFFKQNKIGELTSRINSDTASIRNVVTDTSVSIVNQLMMLAGSLTMMLTLNWRLTLIVLALAPTTTLASKYFGKAVHGSAIKVRDSVANTSAIAHESISGISIVKSMSREEHEAERYGASLQGVLRNSMRAILISIWFRTSITLLTSLSTVAIFWYGGFQVFDKSISAGELVAFLFYVQNVTQAFSGFAQLYANLNQATGSSTRVFELLAMRPSIRDADHAQPITAPVGEIVFDHVHFGHSDGNGILRDFNLHVQAGEIVVLAGHSGCGKTTAINLLPRLYDPSAGRVLFDGVDLRDLPLRWLRDRLALVSQDVFLFSGSIADNIRYGRLDASDQQVREAAEFAEAHDFIDSLPEGYATEVGERGVKLSGGQRQRIALARAFLRSPQILVLDEGTSGIDSTTESRIYESVILWSRRTGSTVLIVAHRSSAMPLADRVVMMRDGQIVEEGRYSDLIAREGAFAEMARSIAHSP